MKKMLKIMAMLLVIATVVFAAGCAEKTEETPEEVVEDVPAAEVDDAAAPVAEVDDAAAPVAEEEEVAPVASADEIPEEGTDGKTVEADLEEDAPLEEEDAPLEEEDAPLEEEDAPLEEEDAPLEEEK